MRDPNVPWFDPAVFRKPRDRARQQAGLPGDEAGRPIWRRSMPTRRCSMSGSVVANPLLGLTGDAAIHAVGRAWFDASVVAGSTKASSQCCK
jgi:hypothetical protein